jgi:hypothetical protein
LALVNVSEGQSERKKKKNSKRIKVGVQEGERGVTAF